MWVKLNLHVWVLGRARDVMWDTCGALQIGSNIIEGKIVIDVTFIFSAKLGTWSTCLPQFQSQVLFKHLKGAKLSR